MTTNVYCFHRCKCPGVFGGKYPEAGVLSILILSPLAQESWIVQSDAFRFSLAAQS